MYYLCCVLTTNLQVSVGARQTAMEFSYLYVGTFLATRKELK